MASSVLLVGLQRSAVGISSLRSSALSLTKTTHRFLASSSSVLCSNHNSDRNELSIQNFDLHHPECNVTENIASRIGRNLHRQPNHPLYIITKSIVDYMNQTAGDSTSYKVFDDLSPIVTTRHNFDVLRIPPDHVSRSRSDTYYLTNENVLRTHTSAHQIELLASESQFLVVGDVYRRDEIDRSHYPVFHQMEGIKLFCKGNLSEEELYEQMEADLKGTLEGLARHLFGENVKMRWDHTATFPFTHPSFELEILFSTGTGDDESSQEWMEVLGCGIIHPEILYNAKRRPSLDASGSADSYEYGWAFGLGLERLAMILFNIPDIRLFWTDDHRFHQQFASGTMEVAFQPYSKYPPCYKDITFWLPNGQDSFHVNDFNELVRDIGGDLIEEVRLIDDFCHPKTGRQSHCYRIVYRSMDRSLTNEEIDALQVEVRDQVERSLRVELR